MCVCIYVCFVFFFNRIAAGGGTGASPTGLAAACSTGRYRGRYREHRLPARRSVPPHARGRTHPGGLDLPADSSCLGGAANGPRHGRLSAGAWRAGGRGVDWRRRAGGRARRRSASPRTAPTPRPGAERLRPWRCALASAGWVRPAAAAGGERLGSSGVVEPATASPTPTLTQRRRAAAATTTRRRRRRSASRAGGPRRISLRPARPGGPRCLFWSCPPSF